MSKTIPVEGVLALVKYLEVDERKHFERMQADGDDTSNHIFNAVRTVSNWLDGQPGIPTAAERERLRLAPIIEAFAANDTVVGDFADFWLWQSEHLH